MNAELRLDAYVTETLMRDLVGHDRRPSAFIVYLALAAAAASGKAVLSHAQLADRTGLSKRAVQDAVALLRRRELIRAVRRGPTEPLHYEPLRPWARAGGG